MDDLVGDALGEFAGPAAQDGPQLLGVVPDESLGEDGTVRVDDLDGDTGLELAVHAGHTGREE